MSELKKSREYFSPHMIAVWETLDRPMFLRGIYKLCRVRGVPDSSVRRILFTFKEEKLVFKEKGLWQRKKKSPSKGEI